jgi:hypothetical protein
MSIRKPWQRWPVTDPKTLPLAVGVFELGDESGRTLYVGVAGARERFGLRSALERAFANPPEGATHFRCEVTTAYATRHLDLLMRHEADNGSFPSGNLGEQLPQNLGRYRRWQT